MNDRKLAKAMRLIAECERRSGSAQPKTIEMLEQGAARLDALRWRSVEEGLPEMGLKVEADWGGHIGVRTTHRVPDGTWLVAYIGWLVDPVRWRYATPPGAEGGGE